MNVESAPIKIDVVVISAMPRKNSRSNGDARYFLNHKSTHDHRNNKAFRT